MYQLGTDMACIPSIFTKIANMFALRLWVGHGTSKTSKFGLQLAE